MFLPQFLIFLSRNVIWCFANLMSLWIWHFDYVLIHLVFDVFDILTDLMQEPTWQSSSDCRGQWIIQWVGILFEICENIIFFYIFKKKRRIHSVWTTSCEKLDEKDSGLVGQRLSTTVWSILRPYFSHQEALGHHLLLTLGTTYF